MKRLVEVLEIDIKDLKGEDLLPKKRRVTRDPCGDIIEEIEISFISKDLAIPGDDVYLIDSKAETWEPGVYPCTITDIVDLADGYKITGWMDQSGVDVGNGLPGQTAFESLTDGDITFVSTTISNSGSTVVAGLTNSSFSFNTRTY